METFDEVDLNYVYSALHHQLKSVSWNVNNETDWETLLAVKRLMARIEKKLDVAD